MKIPLILDGAMGTELKNRGVKIPLPLWSAEANVIHPDIVKSIHQDYIFSGADIITTNTFRTTSWTYKKSNLSIDNAKIKAKNSLYRAVQCAHKAKNNNDKIKIAGSITSIEDCYEPSKYPGDRIACEIYGETIEWIVDSGVDLILFETMGNINEIKCALSLVKHCKLPIWLSLIMQNNNVLLDGTDIDIVFNQLSLYNLDCILNNCNQTQISINTCERFILNNISSWGVYPNIGKTEFDNDYFDLISDYNFKEGIKSILLKNPDVIGICCGSTPSHLKSLKKLINIRQQQ